MTFKPFLVGILAIFSAQAQVNGFLNKGGHQLYPIGIYEMPKTDAGLKEMAASGINLVHCSNRADLDRAAAVGMMGWVSLPMQIGDDAKGTLRKAVEGVTDHPALAVLEGPDEIVWGFTAASGLYKSGIYKQPNEWWLQTPLAVERSDKEAAKIMPKLREGARLVWKLDHGRHPLWINEAARSDMKFIRQYMDTIDITGCDIYPVGGLDNETIPVVGDYTERYKSIGRGRPVWMVLQGFSWGLLPNYHKRAIYPTFAQTRMMAYDVIAHGARGVLYWGTYLLPADSPFRQSIYAMTSELSALQPFLTAPEHPGVHVKLTEANGRLPVGDRGVQLICRKVGRQWLIVLINEDDHAHQGVELTGLAELNGSPLELLYGTETVTVQHGGFVTRLTPHEVKVFATSRQWETKRLAGREFVR